MGSQPAADPAIFADRLFEGFENLMPFRVQDILLVSSLYDSFILREDGRLNELLIGESLELDLQQIPGITHVSTGEEALALARSQPRFNLIVTNLQVGDMNAAELARKVKEAGLDTPVLVLAYDYREIKNFIARNPQTDIDRIFLWQGNVRILIAMVKYIEDKRNALHDTEAIGVPIVLLVEDNIRYYSSFLPVIYTELITQSRRIISEGLNVAHKLVRMRARPKILLCANYEQAIGLVEKYRALSIRSRFRLRIPAQRGAYARRRFRPRPLCSRLRSRYTRHSAIQPNRVHGTGARGAISLSPQALANSALGSEPLSCRAVRLRGLRLPLTERTGSRSRGRHERT